MSNFISSFLTSTYKHKNRFVIAKKMQIDQRMGQIVGLLMFRSRHQK